jgi:hypothetical protein
MDCGLGKTEIYPVAARVVEVSERKDVMDWENGNAQSQANNRQREE